MDIEGGLAEIGFTLEVKRADTGIVEKIDFIGHADNEVLMKIIAEENLNKQLGK